MSYTRRYQTLHQNLYKFRRVPMCQGVSYFGGFFASFCIGQNRHNQHTSNTLHQKVWQFRWYDIMLHPRRDSILHHKRRLHYQVGVRQVPEYPPDPVIQDRLHILALTHQAIRRLLQCTTQYSIQKQGTNQSLISGLNFKGCPIAPGRWKFSKWLKGR